MDEPEARISLVMWITLCAFDVLLRGQKSVAGWISGLGVFYEFPSPIALKLSTVGNGILAVVSMSILPCILHDLSTVSLSVSILVTDCIIYLFLGLGDTFPCR